MTDTTTQIEWEKRGDKWYSTPVPVDGGCKIRAVVKPVGLNFGFSAHLARGDNGQIIFMDDVLDTWKVWGVESAAMRSAEQSLRAVQAHYEGC